MACTLESDKRICSGCGLEKSITEFGKKGDAPTGYQYLCKTCLNDRSRELYQENIIRRREISLKSIKKSKTYEPMKFRAMALSASIKWRSTRDNIIYDPSIDAEYIYHLLMQTPSCPICGNLIHYSYNKEPKRTRVPSVDRIDPISGYIKDNIKIVCWRCNRLKSDASVKEVYNILKYMEQNARRTQTIIT